jgi:hypothetical protein
MRFFMDTVSIEFLVQADISNRSQLALYMSTERKNPLKRDQALNDATSGQLGEEPRPDPYRENDPRREAARKKSKQV